MKVDELMVGNWVLFCGDKYQIRKEDFSANYDFEPIPLTKEILEKNGFVFMHDIFDGIYPMLSMIYCDYKLLEDDKWINGGENQDIRYVHELQNALKFCKVKREIIL